MPDLPPNTYSDFPQFAVTSAVNVLLLDALNTPLSDQMYVRQQMLQYLKNIPPGTRIAVFTLASRLRIVQGFTTDSSVIAKALHEPDCLAFRMVKSRGEDLNNVRAALLQNAQGFEVRPPNAPSRGIQVRLVNEDGREFAVMQWQGRPPNIGEAISLPDPDDVVSTWRILDLN
jgi:hypothetical protein